MAAGLLDRADAVAYFKQFPQLLDQSVDSRELIKPMTFERLLAMIVAAKPKDFVIVCHGHSDALLINLTKESKLNVGVSELDILENVQVTQRELPDAGTDMARWRRILRRLKIDMPGGWRDLDEAKARELRNAVDRWLDGAAQTLGITRARLGELVTLVGQVQARGLGKVDFLGCDLGKTESVLARFRRFFGAKRMRAPQVTSFFGTLLFSKQVNATAVRDTARAKGANVYGEAGQQVVIAITYAGYSAALKGATETEAAAVDWVSTHVGSLAKYSQKVPLHWLQTDPPAWPRDRDYTLNLSTAAAP